MPVRRTVCHKPGYRGGKKTTKIFRPMNIKSAREYHQCGTQRYYPLCIQENMKGKKREQKDQKERSKTN